MSVDVLANCRRAQEFIRKDDIYNFSQKRVNGCFEMTVIALGATDVARIWNDLQYRRNGIALNNGVFNIFHSHGLDIYNSRNIRRPDRKIQVATEDWLKDDSNKDMTGLFVCLIKSNPRENHALALFPPHLFSGTTRRDMERRKMVGRFDVLYNNKYYESPMADVLKAINQDCISSIMFSIRSIQ